MAESVERDEITLAALSVITKGLGFRPRHPPATLSAATADLDALIHVADLFATLRTRFAHLCTDFAYAPVQGGAASHEVS